MGGWHTGSLARLGALSARWPSLAGVLTIFLLSRLAFYVAAFTGTGLFPEAGAWAGRVHTGALLALDLHWRWDAVHYYTIAASGYAAPGLPAFFPVLPLLLRAMATMLGGFQPIASVPIDVAGWQPLVAGVMVAHIATLVAFWLLFQLSREQTGDEALARRAVTYMAIFPLAFYYAVPYAESVFLAASIGTFLAARRQQWVRAGLWAAVASGTRPFGILLTLALALEIGVSTWRGDLQTRAWPRALLGLAIAPAGLLLFMLYLWLTLGEPLAFVSAQQATWNRNPIFPLVTLWRGLGYTLFPARSGSAETYTRTVVHTLTVVGFLAVMLVSLRQWRPSYVLYGLLLFFVTLQSPWPGEAVMHTLGRSIMVLFPVYVTLAEWGRRAWVHQAILVSWLPLFGLLAALYVRWYFVA